MQMADPTAIVPYHDPFDDIRAAEQILMFDDEDPSLCFSKSHSFPEPSSCNPSLFQPIGDNTANADDSSAYPSAWDIGNDHPADFSSQAGPSEIPNFPYEGNGEPQTSVFGNPMQLADWPVLPLPYTCSFCQVLREINHTNGVHMTKLEIHGRLGMICHAVLMDRNRVNLTTQNQEYQMLDFCKESISSIKQFLVEYCEERKRAGYSLLQDPLLIFYEALCVGINGDEGFHSDDHLHPSRTNPDDLHPENLAQPETVDPARAETEREAMRVNRTSLAAQRERTGKMTLRDLTEYFHLPIDEAAKQMNVCPTVMKKICRKHGLPRWPYRKIKSIERQITKKKEALSSADAEERTRAHADIEKLEQELASVFAPSSDS